VLQIANYSALCIIVKTNDVTSIFYVLAKIRVEASARVTTNNECSRF
jgi:hypothetical protein